MTPSFNVEVEFDVYCSCGTALCNDAETVDHVRYREGRKLTVGPCESCLEKARDEGYEKGYDEGHEAGERERP